MSYQNIKRALALLVFLISGTVFVKSVQPSVSFWDCGECAAATHWLQVPHPPGAPFFLLLGRIFAMLPIADNPALRTNLLSVFVSAFSVMLLFLVIIKIIENYKSKEYSSISDALLTFLPAFIGALAFSFSHSFWFNAVETEIYATNTFVFALIIYFLFRWHERAENQDHTKYLLIIAYLIGISTTLRLLGVLAFTGIVMVIFFKKYVSDDEALKKSFYLMLAHIGILLIVALGFWASETVTEAPDLEAYKAFDKQFMAVMAIISIVFIGVFRKKLFNRNSIYVPIFVGAAGLTFVYMLIVKHIPDYLSALTSNNSVASAVIFTVFVIGLIALAYYLGKKNKQIAQIIVLSTLFIVLGYSSYTMIVIRSNKPNLPMNENQPDNLKKIVPYLNREQYGDFPMFKRRYSQEPHQQGIYSAYNSDLDFLWRYQLNHMMTRYILWTYGGRASWYQDAGPNFGFLNPVANLVIGSITKIKFQGDNKDSFFGIPIFLALLGIYFHFRKDWKMALCLMVIFIFVSYLYAFYQNQQQPQPRERDKFYATQAFMLAIWISIAISSLIDIVKAKVSSANLAKALSFGVILLGFLFVPGRMLQANYYTHTRANNFVPWDLAYNLLQSCEPNAILVTAGDNDTFPLWYLQDAEGVRRDVRIVNLSLLNTDWYAKQVKNNMPFGTDKVAMTYSDEELEQMQPTRWETKADSIPVPQEVLQNYYSGHSEALGANITTSKQVVNTIPADAPKVLRFTVRPTLGDVGIRVQDILLLDIIKQNAWKRPIHISVTAGGDATLGLDNYLQMVGLSFKLVPEDISKTGKSIDIAKMREYLFNNKTLFTSYYNTKYERGFKFRGLNTNELFYDDNHIRMAQNYRNAYLNTAMYYMQNNDNPNVIYTLDQMNKNLSIDNLEMDFKIFYTMCNLYYNAGAKQQFNTYANKFIKIVTDKLSNDKPSLEEQQYYNPYQMLVGIYQRLERYDDAIKIMRQMLTEDPSNKNLQQQIQQMEMMKTMKRDSIVRK